MLHKDKVVVRFSGGLGNQLFEFAAGLALARRLGVELALDVTSYGRDPLREFRLGALTGPEIQVISSYGWVQELRDRVGAWLHLQRRKAVRFGLPQYQPATTGWDPSFLSIDRPVCLFGTFASEKYFFDIARSVRQMYSQFTFESEPARHFAAQIQGSNICAVHIRRGDYVENSKRRWQFGLMGFDYYERARQYVRERVGDDLKFAIFSDDIGDATEMLRDWGDQIVCEGTSDIDDILLMSMCQHHIIANSTFSWWGAWLAEWRGQVVVAPQHWFANRPEPTDIVPERWGRV